MFGICAGTRRHGFGGRHSRVRMPESSEDHESAIRRFENIDERRRH
jgi:hypothetical protein